MEKYRSPYEAYPFLSDDDEDLRCDFEILTDRLSSLTGLLAAQCPERREEILRLDELIYHLNPSLRTFFSIRKEEIAWLDEQVRALRKEVRGRCERFVLPAGSERACQAHLARVEGKNLVRMLYRARQRGLAFDDGIIDFTSLVSGYFFHLALWLNQVDGVAEIPFVSRNYK